MIQPRSPHASRSAPRLRAAVPLVAALLVAALALALALPSTAAARAAGAGAPAESLAVSTPIAAASPDLPGLARLAPELSEVEVGGAAFDRAATAYSEAATGLATAQGARSGMDRATTDLAARQAVLTRELVAARSRLAGLSARLANVERAIADLAVTMYVGGRGSARIDAALTDEDPAINDHDRRAVLSDASLAVLLQERAAYRQRVDDAAARVATAVEEIDRLAQERTDLGAARPAAVERETSAGADVATERVRYEEARALATVDGADFTLVTLDAYLRAARSVAADDPACGVRWWGVAGISRVEGHHGTYGGSSVDVKGDTTKPIIGIQLNGTNETAVITDSDGGALDGDPAFDRAVGPMQFIPQTWARFASDGNGDGTATPFNLYDATLAAARYLCTASHGLDGDAGLRTAYFSYNHSVEYVDQVLAHARAYERSVPLPGA